MAKSDFNQIWTTYKTIYHAVPSPAAALRGATASTTEAEDPFDSEEGL